MRPRSIPLLAFFLGAVTLVSACDEDKIGPETEGSISIRFLTEVPATTEGTAARIMPEFPVVSKARAGEESGAIRLVASEITINKSDSGAVRPSDTTETILREFQPPTVDAIEVRLTGAATRTEQLTRSGNEFVGTITDVQVGTYVVTVVGFENAEVTYYGSAGGVVVAAGQETVANVNFNLFVPVLDPFTSPTTFTSFAATFTTPAAATGYVFEFDSDAAFTSPTTILTPGGTPFPGSPAPLVASQASTFFLRVRATNGDVPAANAQASNIESIQIIADTTSGNDQASAVAVGGGLLDSLNILPAGDADWFELSLLAGDGLSAWAYAQVLSPVSSLDATLELRNAAGGQVAFNDDDGTTLDAWLDNVPIPADGQYYLIVAGAAQSTGYYELEINIARGGGVDSVAVTPTQDTVQIAGDTTRLTATAYDMSGNPFTGTLFSWSSSDSSIAVPDSTGLVTTIDMGTVTITATAAGGMSASATVVILNPPIDNVLMSQEGAVLTGGGSINFTANPVDTSGATVPGITLTWRSLNPNVATVDQSGNVTAVAAGQTSIEASGVGAAGYAVIIVDDPHPQPVNFLAPATSPTNATVWDVWGVAANAVHAAGQDGALFYDGANWSVDYQPGVPLLGVWGAAADEVFLVGEGGEVTYFDGATYTSQSSGTIQDLLGVWGSAPDNVYAAGRNGAVLRFDGATWTGELSGGPDLYAVWGSSADEVFVVGDAGTIHHYDKATGWNSMTSNTTENLRSVWGTRPTNVYAVGENGTVRHYNGTSWSGITNPAGVTLTEVWGTGSTDIYVAGLGETYHFDGTATWTLVSNDNLEGFFGTPNPSIHGVGLGGLIQGAYRGATYTVDGARDTLVSINDTITVVAWATDSNANPISNVTVQRWTSSDTTVATVDSLTGLVTAKGAGTADITGMTSSLSDIFSVTVYQTVVSVDVTSGSGDSVLVAPAAKDTLIAVAYDANGFPVPGRARAWTSADTTTATVDPTTGEVTGVAVGKTVMTAAVDGITGTTNLLVPLQTDFSRTFGSGSEHTCALDAGGNAYCWGRNTNDALGNGTGVPSSVPVMVQGGLTFTSLSVGQNFNCGLTASGEIYCWGRGSSGQLGNGSTGSSATPVKVFGSQRWHHVEAGSNHACAITIVGEGFCWGDGAQGKRGDNTTTGISIPTAIMGGITFQSVSSGSSHSCGVATGGQGHCWGQNEYGQLGDGAGGSGIQSHTPVAVSGGIAFQNIDTGDNHSCGFDNAGAGHCWGYNWAGQLGNNNPGTNQFTPVAVLGGVIFQDISTWASSTCGTSTTNGGFCWGYNYRGVLGDSTQSYRYVPTAVYGSHLFTEVVVGNTHGCGRDTGSALWCWGQNAYGQVGTGVTIPITPQPVSGAVNFAMTTGGYQHTCGLDTSGNAYCWGDGGFGQIGDGANTNDSVPTLVAGGNTFGTLSSAAYHNCGLTATGTVLCWGYNYYGQLGNGTYTNASVVQTVTGTTNSYIDVDVGASFSCGVDNTNAAHCWGRNFNGSLGDGGVVTDSINVPTAVAGGISFTKVTAGNFHACGLATDSTAYCWGTGTSGQLGNGGNANSSVPVAVSGGMQFTAITAGRNHTCAIAVGGGGYCWGSSSYNGTGQYQSTPAQIAPTLTWSNIDANFYDSTCGTTTTGDVYCWGRNNNGELGDGTFNWSNTPITPSGGFSAIHAMSTYQHSCLVNTTNQAYCWGNNDQGQIGLGGASSFEVAPVMVTGGLTYLVPPFAGYDR